MNPISPSHQNIIGAPSIVDFEFADLNAGQQVQVLPSSTEPPTPAKSSPTKVFGGRIILNKGISRVNFYTSWAYVLYLGIMGLTYTTLEPEFINKTFNIPDAKMGETTAWLYLIDYSIRLVFALLYGPMIDHFGRRFVMTICIVLVSLSYLAVPLFSSSLFPGYLGAKALYSCGGIGLQMLPIAADYVDNTTKGIMAAMNFGIAFIGGGIGAALLKTFSVLDVGYTVIYTALAAIVFLMGMFLRLGIKGGNTYYRIEKDNIETLPALDNATKWKEVKRAFREEPWVTISVLFGVLGNTDFYILTTGLVIWVKSLVPEGVDPISIAANLQVVFTIMSFILTATIALKIDKIPHMRLVGPILLVSTLGFIFVPFVRSSGSPLLYIFCGIEGASLPGVLVYSAYLSYRYNPPEIRGTLSGIGNGIGFLGAIVILSVGGVLHDYWRKDASFLLYAGLMVFTLVVVLIMSQTMMKNKKKVDDDVSKIRLNTLKAIQQNDEVFDV